MRNSICIFFGILFLPIYILSQDLFLKSGTYAVDTLKEINSENLFGSAVHDQFSIIVFDKIPDGQRRQILKSAGIELLDYLPRNAFIAYIPEKINSFDQKACWIKKIIPFRSEFKVSKELLALNIPAHAYNESGQIELVAQYFTVLDEQSILDSLFKNGFQVLDTEPGLNAVRIQLKAADIQKFIQQSFIQFIDFPTPPAEPENDAGRREHRSNTLFTDFPSGLKYRGDGFQVMMQDDGYIGPHIDYTGRIDQSNCSPCSTDPTDNHGDHVAGTIMGAGNLDPRARGMAHGADLLVYNSSNNNYSLVPNLYQNNDVFITSKSYSNGCNAGYTSLTQELDQQVRLYPSLIHVFSAGNSGTSDCGYGAGDGWGNITGGHKAGKNVVAVGNLTSSNILASSSSRGPASDGRIKPDICGIGTQVYSTVYDNNYDNFTGTSMSCPGVAGTITQLYDAFQDINGGTIPPSGLIKGTVLNTADDLGNPGPDFQYGWGKINARRAFEVINDGTYLTDVIDQGQQHTHQITVPTGTKQLRVMVYWTDYEGSTSASLALVNDLNIALIDPLTTTYEPWVLDPTPNAVALDAVAVRGTDNLNNMEQVTLENPQAGVYTINVDGFNVPQGPQEYFLIYYLEKDEINVTFPIGGEGLHPGTGEVIAWDAPEGTDPFNISFSEDNGATWTSIGTAQANLRQFYWNIPSGTLTGEGRIKIERNGIEGMSEASFSVIATPTDLGVEWVCPDSLMLSWNPVTGATGYAVSMLGAKYMDSITFTSDTNVVLNLPSSLDSWFSVKSYGPNGAVGERAVAYHKVPGEFQCLWSAPIAGFDVDCNKAGENYCFNLIPQAANTDTSTAVITWYFPGGTPAISNDPSPQVCYDVPGLYDLIMVVDNGYGTDSLYQAGFIEATPAKTLPYYESFENQTTFVSNEEWSATSIGIGSPTFEINTTVGLSGTQSAFIQNYGQPAGTEDELISGSIDLSSLQSTDDVTLSFRYAYRKRNTSDEEWLRVYINKSCLDPWILRKTIKGNTLSELVSASNWEPAGPEDWITVHVTNITSSYYSSDFRFKFNFQGDGGNNLYLDDINIYQGPPSNDIVGLSEDAINFGFNVYPNPASEEINIQFESLEKGQVIISVQTLAGQMLENHVIVPQTGKNMVLIDSSQLAAGMYLISFTQGGITSTKKITVR
ncbi:MAG: S8 family serine peptidase [Brumimicrobium sp.]|nr:S8 family serine peptidase [Brumimicrobium sp.]